jgi:hypothetical protein
MGHCVIMKVIQKVMGISGEKGKKVSILTCIGRQGRNVTKL